MSVWYPLGVTVLVLIVAAAIPIREAGSVGLLLWAMRLFAALIIIASVWAIYGAVG